MSKKRDDFTFSILGLLTASLGLTSKAEIYTTKTGRSRSEFGTINRLFWKSVEKEGRFLRSALGTNIFGNLKGKSVENKECFCVQTEFRTINGLFGTSKVEKYSGKKGRFLSEFGTINGLFRTLNWKECRKWGTIFTFSAMGTNFFGDFNWKRRCVHKKGRFYVQHFRTTKSLFRDFEKIGKSVEKKSTTS